MLRHLLLLLPLVTATLHIGTGIYDATGPINDILMMGMANPAQVNAGLHQRLRARTFIALDDTTGKRFAFVSLDSGMSGTVLKNRVIADLEKLYPSVYSQDNVAISGTHTHSGPSGFLQDVIFQFAGSGWQPQTLDAYVNGVVQSIVNAHKGLTPASASVAVGELDKSNINRSPTAYLENPADERAKYEHDTDHVFTQVKFTSADDKEMGLFNWFAVHPTSMNNTNLLVSGDNKGYASYMFEKHMNGASSRPGQGPFVAAFASTNLGDVSPNTLGPRCRDTGLPCDTLHSTCNGKTQMCSSVGPGKDMFDSCEIIGRQQFEKAQELFTAKNGTQLSGVVDYVHTFVHMPGLKVTDPSTGAALGSLCTAAMGDSFAAGTTDGPGAFDFTQGSNSTNIFWNIIVDLIHKPTPEEAACQHPKGILIPTGVVNFPHPWAPDVLPMQILRLGELVILAVPTEMSTMAGRRLRESIKTHLINKGVITESAFVVIAGLSNAYADYTTTFEEYQQQRYEGGSTIYGPHQLNAYIQEMTSLANAMAAGVAPDPGTPPVDFSDKLGKGKNYSTDHLPSGAKNYGDVLEDVQASYKAGDVVSVTFAAGNPLNNLRHQSTFFNVERCSDGSADGPACSKWEYVAEDGDWETRLHIIKSKVGLLKLDTARSVNIEWYTPATTPAGTYRIVHDGTWYKNPTFGKATFTDYQGVSSSFTIA